MKRKQDILICVSLFVLLCFLQSCNRRLSTALDLAGKNRTELEKVLNHFKNDPDPLKYESAKFLIENMPYHYSVYGKGMKGYEAAYVKMAHEPKEFRDSVFQKACKGLDLQGLKPVPDIRTVKADYLIRAINDAVDTWNTVNWNKDYDKSIFFDYVLPYRLSDEPL